MLICRSYFFSFPEATHQVLIPCTVYKRPTSFNWKKTLTGKEWLLSSRGSGCFAHSGRFRSSKKRLLGASQQTWSALSGVRSGQCLNPQIKVYAWLFKFAALPYLKLLFLVGWKDFLKERGVNKACTLWRRDPYSQHVLFGSPKWTKSWFRPPAGPSGEASLK